MNYEYDYETILEDTDDLYDNEDCDIEDSQTEWENYYHNITDELIDD